MADVRALLKAKRQEARITHPLATYTSSGQLRCIVCDASVKHASAWEGHVGSKTHRTNAARLREERAREARAQTQREAEESHKRKTMEVDVVGDGEDDDEDVGMRVVDKKRRRVESEEPVLSAAVPPANTKRGALPADFFSDPSMAHPPMEEEEEEGAEGLQGAAAAVNGNAPQDTLDLEWAAFQQSVVNVPDYHETYERATVVAEPVLATEVPQGFPSSSADADGTAEAERVEELDEEGLRRKKQEEERELIMDRLMEEEQAQQEADERVSVLKNKLEALRRKREAVKAAKRDAKSS